LDEVGCYAAGDEGRITLLLLYHQSRLFLLSVFFLHETRSFVSGFDLDFVW
jgi:hypothetical protein